MDELIALDESGAVVACAYACVREDAGVRAALLFVNSGVTATALIFASPQHENVFTLRVPTALHGQAEAGVATDELLEIHDD